LVVEGEMVGALAIFAREPFSEQRLVGIASIPDAVAQGIRRKRAERELREAEVRYRTLVENVPAVTYIQQIADPDSSRTSPTMYASPQIEAQSGYPPRAFEEDPELWIKLLHPEDRERVLAEDALTDETGEPFVTEYRQIARDGRVVWIRDQAALVRDEEGEPLYWQGVQLDITELKRAEETLQEANQHLEELAALRADFTAMVAHEIGSPLAAVRGFLEVLGTGELEPAEQAEALAKIRTEVGRLSTLVADVRSAAAVESGEFDLMLRRTPVEELLADAARFAEALPGGHPLTVETVADGPVLADPYRIGQVLRNLLLNAARYSPEGAPIELRARPGETPGRLRVEVADHGRGVHPDDAERIFEKFGRGRDPSGKQAYGVGLGLYLSRRIVRAHGSELALDPAPGSGSVFSFELEADL
jgi:PAS domain S-box-containing protein